MPGSVTLKVAALGLGLPLAAVLLYLLLKGRGRESGGKPKGSTAPPRNETVGRGRQTVIEVKVPGHAVGAIIGRNGANIKKMEEETFTRIKFINDGENKKNEVLTIKGKEEDVQCAERMIQHLILDIPVTQTETVWIPKYTVGRIIGRQGNTIRQLSQASGTRINVSRREDGKSSQREVTIHGSSAQIQHAKYLIQEKITEEDVASNYPRDVAANKQQTAKEKFEIAVKMRHWKSMGIPVLLGDVGVRLCAANSPSQFWIQLTGPPAEQFKALAQQMNHYYSSDTHRQAERTSEFVPGDLVSLRHDQVGWVRGQVVGVGQAKPSREEIPGKADQETVQGKEESQEQARETQESDQEKVAGGEEIQAGEDLEKIQVSNQEKEGQEDDQKKRQGQEESSEDRGQVEVFLVDLGITTKVPSQDVFSLKMEFNQLPYQAVECCLAAVSPQGDDWSEESVAIFREWCFKPGAGGDGDRGGGLKVRPVNGHPAKGGKLDRSVPTTVKLFDLGRSKVIGIGEKLVELGYARWSRLDVPQPMSSMDLVTYAINQRQGREIRLPLGKDGRCQVLVSAVCSPDSFWVTPVQKASLGQLINQMTSYYSLEHVQQKKKVAKVGLGDFVSAPYPNEDHWYRAQVMEVQGQSGEVKVDLYYVDFGDSAVMRVEQLCALDDKFQKLPIQAVECCLADVKPKGQQWSEEAILAFEELSQHTKGLPVTAQRRRIVPKQGGLVLFADLDLFENSTQVATVDAGVATALVQQGHAVDLAVAQDSSHQSLLTDKP